MKKIINLLLSLILLTSCATTTVESKIEVKVLILSCFEIGEMSGDDPGEVQFYYEEYCIDSTVYTIEDGKDGSFYYKDGIGLYVNGMTKANASTNVLCLLKDERFDFSNAYIISTGCAGGAEGYAVMGDVVIASAIVDYDIGHTADERDLLYKEDPVWYEDSTYVGLNYKLLNQDLVNELYELTKDIKLETTEKTMKSMSFNFDDADWAIRNPQVIKGTNVSSDNYWKGEYNHDKAVYMCNYYDTPDPFAATEMENSAIALVLEKMGLLDRYIILRDIVNMDVFTDYNTPESLWNPDYTFDTNGETIDIFGTAMENNFKVGKVIIEYLLNK